MTDYRARANSTVANRSLRTPPPAVGLATTTVNSGNRPQAGYPTNTNHRRPTPTNTKSPAAKAPILCDSCDSASNPCASNPCFPPRKRVRASRRRPGKMTAHRPLCYHHYAVTAGRGALRLSATLAGSTAVAPMRCSPIQCYAGGRPNGPGLEALFRYAQSTHH